MRRFPCPSLSGISFLDLTPPTPLPSQGRGELGHSRFPLQGGSSSKENPPSEKRSIVPFKEVLQAFRNLPALIRRKELVKFSKLFNFLLGGNPFGLR